MNFLPNCLTSLFKTELTLSNTRHGTFRQNSHSNVIETHIILIHFHNKWTTSLPALCVTTYQRHSHIEVMQLIQDLPTAEKQGVYFTTLWTCLRLHARWQYSTFVYVNRTGGGGGGGGKTIPAQHNWIYYVYYAFMRLSILNLWHHLKRFESH